MEPSRWIWIPLVLVALIWGMIFVFGLFGFVEAFANAPEDWWQQHKAAYWLLLVGGLLCLPVFHGIVWLAGQVDEIVVNRVGAIGPDASVVRRGLNHVGGLFIWGLWIAMLVGAAARFALPRPEIDIPAPLLSFQPVELGLWAFSCGLASLTVLALVDQMKGRASRRSVLVLLLHITCYVWFYAAADGMVVNPANQTWLIIVFATLASFPMAWLLGQETPEHVRPEEPGS